MMVTGSRQEVNGLLIVSYCTAVSWIQKRKSRKEILWGAILMNQRLLQTYWGAFCSFAEPLSEVMGAYLSAPITEKVESKAL